MPTLQELIAARKQQMAAPTSQPSAPAATPQANALGLQIPPKPAEPKIVYGYEQTPEGEFRKKAFVTKPEAIPPEGMDLGPAPRNEPQYQGYHDMLKDARSWTLGLRQMLSDPYFQNMQWDEMSHQNTSYEHGGIGAFMDWAGLGNLSKAVGGPTAETDPRYSRYAGVLGQVAAKLSRVYMGGRPSEYLFSYLSDHFLNKWNPPKQNQERADALLSAVLSEKSFQPFNKAEMEALQKTKAARMKEGVDEETAAAEAAAIIRINRVMTGDGGLIPDETF